MLHMRPRPRSVALIRDRAHRFAGHQALTVERRNSLPYGLGMDYLLVVHDPTLTALVRPTGNRPICVPLGIQPETCGIENDDTGYQRDCE